MNHKNILTIIVIITLLGSCSIFRKVTKAEDIIEIDTTVVIDTSKSSISSNNILVSIIEKNDLSKAVITEYYKPDSNGKQGILRTIEIGNNISTKHITKEDIALNYDQRKGIVLINRDSISVKKSDKIETKAKAISGFGVSLLIFLGLILFIGLFWKKILLLFK